MFSKAKFIPKLTEEQIKHARYDYYVNFHTFRSIAERYNVSRALIESIVYYKRYTHIPDFPGITDHIKEQRKGKKGIL